MKDLLIIADSIIHVNFFGLVLNIPKRFEHGYLALDTADEYVVYAYVAPPTLLSSSSREWAIQPNTDVAYVDCLDRIIGELGLNEWPEEIGKNFYKVQDLILPEGATHP